MSGVRYPAPYDNPLVVPNSSRSVPLPNGAAIVLSPSGGDDGPALQAAFATSATRPVHLVPGTYYSSVPLTWPSGAQIDSTTEGQRWTIKDMKLAERVQMPRAIVATANAGTDRISASALPTDTWSEARELDRVMFAYGGATITAAGGDLNAQTVFYKRDVNPDGSFKVARTPGGAAVDITGTGGSFGNNISGKYLAVASNVGGKIQFACKAYGWEEGTEIHISGIAPLPGNIAALHSYYVLPVDADNFQVEATIGGGPVAFSSAGSGFVFLARKRFDPAETSTPTGVTQVAAAAIEVTGGNPNIPVDWTAFAARNYAFRVENVILENCKVTDQFGNQGAVLLEDVFSFSSSNLSIVNRGASDTTAVGRAGDHAYGIVMWDNYEVEFSNTRLEGIEMGLIFVGSWNQLRFDGLELFGADGATTDFYAMIMGLSGPSGAYPKSNPTDIRLENVRFGGYSQLMGTHQASWFAPVDYAWSRVALSNVAMPGYADLPTYFEDVWFAKNATGGTIGEGDVLVVGSFTDADGEKLPQVTQLASDDPEGSCVVLPNNGATFASNAWAPVALGSGIANGLAAEAMSAGAKVYVASGTRTLTVTRPASNPRAKGILRTGKAGTARRVVFRSET